MTEFKQASQYIMCPVCEGTGRQKLGLDCPNCQGMGLGTFSHGRFFYWGLNLGAAVIELDHLRKKTNLIINLFAYTFGLIGLLALIAWVYLASNSALELGAFAFWREKHLLILLFWLSIISDMFVFYRLSEEERQKHMIKAASYDVRNRRHATPDNWEELKKAGSEMKVDVWGGFSNEAMDIVEKSYLLARKLNHEYVLPIHLFFSALTSNEVAGVLTRLEVGSGRLIEKLKDQLALIPVSQEKTVLSRTVKEVLVDAYLHGYKLGQRKVTPKNFLIPVMSKDKVINEIMYDLEIDMNKVYNVILWFIINDKLIENYRIYKSKARFKPGSGMDRAYTAVATPVLNNFGYDLTLAAKWGRLEYCVARDQEIENIFQNFMSGSTGSILVGPSGAGKNIVINGIAQAMVKEDVPAFLKDKRLVELDAARLVSGARPEVAEGRMMAIVDEVIHSGNIVLFIDNVENIIGITSGEEQSLDLSEVLAGALERGGFYCLASATTENYSKYIEGRPLGNALSKIEVAEPKGDQAIQMIESKIGYLEGKHSVYYTYNSLETAVNFSVKYIHDKYLPEKALDILEKAAVKAVRKKGEQSLISKEDIAEIVSEITGIPVTKIGEKESENLIHLEDRIHERMVNQEEAVKMVAAALRRARTELRESKRPIASFLFLGPTGVGKTELAKTVAAVYFGRESYMIRMDMSEYQHPDSVIKMIGEPGGGGGYLTEAARKSPFALVLLDEIEKAHPDIMNLFLQVMDDGRLTDGVGRTIDFTNSIIIATSNIGALYIQDEIFKGTPVENIKSTLIDEHINKIMRPELINRFDGIIVFEPLSKDNLVEITRLMLNEMAKMLEQKGIGLRLTDEGVRCLAEAGYDPKFGARPLRRLLQDRIEDQIANKILNSELKRRDTVVINTSGNVQIEKGKAL